MLDEILEYEQYSFDLSNPTGCFARLKRSRLICGDFSGLNRVLTIIARHFLYDVYAGDDCWKDKTIKALKSWLGHKNPAADRGANSEVLEIYSWLPHYIEMFFLSASLNELKDMIANSNLTKSEKAAIDLLIGKVYTSKKVKEKNEAASLVAEECERLGFVPKNNPVDKSILKITGFLNRLSGRKSFNFSGYSDSGEANDINSICYDRILGNARRGGKLNKFYLACEKNPVEEVTMLSGRKLKESDKDIVLKLTAYCMLELSKKGTQTVNQTKVIYINESALVNWLILKKCEKDKFVKFQYKGDILFEHPISSWKESGQKKGINTKKIQINQNWLTDAGFEILINDPTRNVIGDYLRQHPGGSVFVDQGAGEPFKEIK